jgi:hypothetical protein
VTDFENKFIPSPFSTLQPIPRPAAPAFCAALFYPEFANEFYRQKSAPGQPGVPVPQGHIHRPRNHKKITKQTQFSPLTKTKDLPKTPLGSLLAFTPKTNTPAATNNVEPGNVPKANARMLLDN